MWAYETTFYQIYPLGFCGVPRENAPVGEEPAEPVPAPGDAAAAAPDASQGGVAQGAPNPAPNPSAPICKVADWAPYLERMGFGAVLLNPVFESDSHGYDTRDLTRIDRRLGTNADFADVVRELHAHGVRVVLDAVFNHVGRGFWAFLDVQARRWDSPYKDWFCISFDGDSAWGDGFWYEGWEGHYELVKLNLANPAVVDYLLGCVRGWVRDFGIDGLRLDVAYSLDRGFMHRLRELANELSGEAGEGAAADASRFAADSAPSRLGGDFVLIGETLHGDYNQLVNPDLLHSCTNYECYKGLYSSFNSQNMFEIAHSLHRQFGGDPWCIYRGRHLLSFADNHDVTRLSSIVTDPACVRPAYGVLFGMPGIPCVYYGSEWGATGEKGAHDDYDLRPAFSVPVENNLSAFVSSLVAARDGHAEGLAGEDAARAGRALAYGAYRNVQILNKQLLFERAVEAGADGERPDGPAASALVAVNAVDEPFTLSAGELNGMFVDVLGGAGRAAGEMVTLGGSLELAPYEVRYLLRKQPTASMAAGRG